jgi:uncharacterized protein (TIGR00369 family)
MRKINNPFRKLEGYNCFGCSPDNSLGLKMTFFEDGDEIVSTWDPELHFQGYHKVLHGGIQSAMIDEIGSWVVYVKLNVSGVTSKMEVRYLKPVYVDEGQLTVRARLAGMRRNLADIDVRLFNHAGEICATGHLTYFTLSPEKSKEQLYCPEHGKFFNEEGGEQLQS